MFLGRGIYIPRGSTLIPRLYIGTLAKLSSMFSSDNEGLLAVQLVAAPIT